MTRTLVLIAVVGFLVSLVCFGAVGAMGGVGWHGDWRNWGERNYVRHDGPGRDPGPSATREVAWLGADMLQIDVPATIRYVQGPTPKITIHGPKRLIEEIEVEGGRIAMPYRHWMDWTGHSRIQIEVTAPAVTRFKLNGSQTLEIEGYKQDALSVEINGSGDVSARGQAQRLEIEINGSGEANLDDLQVTDARVEISGSGDATVSPTGLADIEISGSGDVTLTRSPAKLVTDIRGSGDVRTADGDKVEKRDNDEDETGV